MIPYIGGFSRALFSWGNARLRPAIRSLLAIGMEPIIARNVVGNPFRHRRTGRRSD
jgi:hypothetical protein